jgi:GTP-binding protein Era
MPSSRKNASAQVFRSGFVALIGRPNMGKSTLLNRLIGQKVAITSHVAQTTRHRIKGIITEAEGQVVLLDTPGFSKPLDQLGTYLSQEAEAALSEADALMMVVDLSMMPGKGDEWVAQQLQKTGKFILLVMNKMDLVKTKLEIKRQRELAYRHLFSSYSNWDSLSVSARTGKNMAELPQLLISKMPEGPAYYSEDAVTDQRMREIAAEMIREKVLRLTQEEIPHSVAVGIETFEEDTEKKLTRIKATLYVDQPSQKGILIGKAGQMIKQIGVDARKDLEKLTEMQVFLELNVKVKHNWRKDAQFLQSLGLAPPKEV